MQFFLILLALCLTGCSPAPATPPTTTPPAVSREESPPEKQKIPAREVEPPNPQTLIKKESLIAQPAEDWQPSQDDFASLDHWIGGVAGTDSTVLKVQGNGTVTLTSGRQPGGEETTSSGTLDSAETKALFLKLLESKLLEMNEVPRSTVGSTLTVQINGVQDTVVVSTRKAEAEAILGAARTALKQ